MHQFTIQRQTFFKIAWFLTGLMFAGSLLNSLPTVNDSAVCAEERVLEVDDDDRCDSAEVDVALYKQVDEHPASQTWQELQVFYCVHTIAVIPSANLKRGPPTV